MEQLPDISKWKTDKVTDMTYMFHNCKSLKNLPDISAWNISNVRDMLYMFGNCSSLEVLPDLDKWEPAKKVYCLFPGCKETLNIPLKFKG